MSADDHGFVLPTGTVAFLLTDVEGSTKAWEAEPSAMAAAMDRHNVILDEAVSAHGGVSPPAQGEGDSIVAAFARASDAVLAAVSAQRRSVSESWPTSVPLRIRMAVHAGEARFIDDGNYAGHAIIRTARLRAIAQGGQILVSTSAHDLTVDQLGDAVEFRDLGEHRLRDLARPERVWQVIGDGLPADFEPLRSLDSRPHNLPVQLSSFVGRGEEVETLVRLMSSERLVTITGAGGAGKTRLAQQVAAELLETLPDGAWWVELAALTDPVEIPGAIARATGTKAELGDQAVDALVERLAGTRLLIFDNCEHLVAGVARLVDELLRRCPDLRVLATSREPLAVDGELAWRIPPLGVPPLNPPVGAQIETVRQYDAVRLFLDRAQRVRPNFHLDDTSAPLVADICQRLDGIPLAIELAASRCRSLRPEQIRDGLTDRFDLLTGGTRAALPRQQTIEASIAWSHRLLTDPERILFRRLAAFRDGCTLDDAEAVVADDLLPVGTVLDLLDRLVAQSLLVAEDADLVQRYRMLETIRQYAAHQLVDAGEEEVLAGRHARHYVDELSRVAPTFELEMDLDGFRWSVSEMENLDVAIRRIVASGDIRGGVEAVWYLSLAWGLIDPPPCSRLLEAVTAAWEASASHDVELEPRILLARTQLQLWSGAMLQCAIDGQACIEAADRVGDRWAAMRARAYLGQVMAWVDPDASIALHEGSLAVAEELGDRTAETLTTVGLAATYVGILTNIVAGRPYVERSLELADRLGNPLLGSWAASQQALMCGFVGDLPGAERWADIADRHLDVVGHALGPHGPRLMRRNVIRSTTIYAQSYAYAQLDEHLEWIESLPRESAESTAGGYLVTPAMIQVVHGAQMAHLGRYEEAEASLALGRAINARAGTEAAGVHGATYWTDLALQTGDVEEAQRRLATVEGSMIASRSILAQARISLRRAAFALIDGDPLAAERIAHEALGLVAEQGVPWETFQLLEVLAQVAAATDAPEEAARIGGAVAAIRERHGIRVRLCWHADRFDEVMAATSVQLGGDVFEEAFGEGRAMSTDDAVAYVRRARGERKRPQFGWEGLTPTEAKVVEHVTEGRTNPEIATAMFISRETVKTHLSHIFTKLGVSSRSELAAQAARRAAATDGSS